MKNGESSALMSGVAACVAAISLASLGGCKASEKEPAKAGDDGRVLRLEEKSLANVSLEIVKAGAVRLERVFEQAGELVVAPNRHAQLSAPLGGVIGEISVGLGHRVEKGQTLITLESRELAELKLSFVAAAQRLGPAGRALEREEKLLDRKLTTKDAVLQKKAEAQETALALQLARQKLLVLGLNPKTLPGLGREKADALKRLAIVSPISGTITALTAIKGATVSASDKLGEVVDLSDISGELRLVAGRLEGVKPGLEVEVVNSKTGLKGKGRVDYVAPVADPSTRTVLVRLVIPNRDEQARPGCAFTARFRVPGGQVLVSVPAASLHEVEGDKVLFVRRSRLEFEVRRVELGRSDGRVVEVTSGLAPGEDVVSVGSLTLKAEFLKRAESQ
ncbi:MAG: efflux RND transporter periplasmic adaptor subunit [Polyangia bacterium]|jgi:cobalt-zinc-cadmium efflux system membrane fusion protein|nr:efflux RND transporter periplasmic adaptor subunit [Polyangia bacterium]